MNPLTADRFAEFYEAAYGYGPFPWQVRLAKQVCNGGAWPRAIALPTAAGKTTCIDIAVFALACRAPNAPRRIFLVVDRRIVVDQSQLHAGKLASVLAGATDGVLKQVADALRELARPGWRELPKKEQEEVRPLDVYALRGGMYRETAWVRSPLQPTVIASTVDQVGSRLLFRGYGVSDSMKPVHAALVGNDALLLLDEAHCAKPFQQTAEAVERYRGWNESPAPFRFVSITATPTSDDDVMRDDEADQAHAVLGARIRASKPAKLFVAERAKGKNFTAELVKVLKAQAESLVGVDLGETTDNKGNVTQHKVQCVGVIVNRVLTARKLKEALGEDAVLLTGRMRPLDRDRLFRERLQPLLSGADGTPPKFVIGTQCLEVGADFDFHALVTECASLDALRQRFGRLNRIAARPSANAVIVVRGDQTDDTADDPIYGASLGATWRWLNGIATDGAVDFGIAAMRAALTGVDLTPMNAPSADAPVLFPAHLDCWVQTHPIPTPDPDVALWLHGPKEGGQPDVQVVFRDDLGDDRNLWAEIVALCPPSSSEAVAVPIGVFKKWLAGETRDTDTTGDVEGAAADETEPEVDNPRAALCWKGMDSDDTKVISDPNGVRPTLTYLVRCAADANLLGDLATENKDTPPRDYAEEAFQRSRDKALLRLKGFELSEEDEEFEAKLTAEVERVIAELFPEWSDRAKADLSTKSRRIATKYPDGVKGWVVTGKRRLKQFDPEFLDDGASSYSPGREVTLDAHSRGVAAFASRFATGCGLDETLYTQAGFLHDLGKLDPRFQRMLSSYQRDKPLAKSRRAPQSEREREEARLVHRYPKGARHELLSAAIVATRTDDDDLLHLIATHHGSARPFANAVEDDGGELKVSEVMLFRQKWKCDDARQRIADWNPELAERFWRQVRAHGWWGSAFREAVFRLADHAQSRAEQEADADGEVSADVAPPPLRPSAVPQRLFPLPLPGLDGSNPLAFLAALGVLRVADKLLPGTRLRWRAAPHWHPVLELVEAWDEETLIHNIYAAVHRVAEPSAVTESDRLEKLYQKTRKATAVAMQAVKDRQLRGAAREQVIAEEVRPLEVQMGDARRAWLDALDRAVPAPFLALGKSIAVSGDEFAAVARRIAELLISKRQSARFDADFLPAFGCEACVDRNEKVIPTDFQLITGSGHQFFLETFATLMEGVTEEQLHRSLIGPWTFQDLRLSFRWEPTDDRRYATSWNDPSSVVVQTEHAANLLAAIALPLFPVAPDTRSALTTGFHRDDDESFLTWPIWEDSRSVDGIRSLLSTAWWHGPRTAPNKRLAHHIRVLYRVRKFEVGKAPLSKWNVSTSVVV